MSPKKPSKVAKVIPLYYGEEKQPYAKGTIVYPPNGLVFLSGMSGVDPESGHIVWGFVKSHTKLAWRKIQKHLEDLGSSLENIVKIVYYIPNGRDYESVMEATNEFWKENCPELLENPPPNTVVVAKLAHPGYQVEIDVIGAIPREVLE